MISLRPTERQSAGCSGQRHDPCRYCAPSERAPFPIALQHALIAPVRSWNRPSVRGTFCQARLAREQWHALWHSDREIRGSDRGVNRASSSSRRPAPERNNARRKQAMSTQHSLTKASAARDAVVADPPLFALREQAEPAVTTAPASPAGAAAEPVLATLPGKRPLVKLSEQPVNYESPIDYLGAAITPNEAFFVRYNLADVPRIEADGWRVAVGGAGAKRHAELSLADLRKLPAAEVVAVCQCSGNGRSLFQPPAPGVQWGRGAIGCARWKGARLKDVLDLVGMRDDALEVVFAGADKAGSQETADFSKSLPVWKAREENTLVAYEMNGRPLPHLHGFPARLVVSGWTATYWVKHVSAIMVATAPFDGYWMRSTYRVPLGTFPCAARFASQDNGVDTAITEMMVNALITGPCDGAT